MTEIVVRTPAASKPKLLDEVRDYPTQTLQHRSEQAYVDWIVPKYCYVYVLRSLKDNQFYVGLTRDLHSRVQHNKGLVTSTRKRAPFELVIGRAA